MNYIEPIAGLGIPVLDRGYVFGKQVRFSERSPDDRPVESTWHDQRTGLWDASNLSIPIRNEFPCEFLRALRLVHAQDAKGILDRKPHVGFDIQRQWPKAKTFQVFNVWPSRGSRRISAWSVDSHAAEWKVPVNAKPDEIYAFMAMLSGRGI